MYFGKTVRCRINFSSNARLWKQQNKVVAVVTTVYTEKTVSEKPFQNSVALNYTEENFSITNYFIRVTTKF